MTGMRQAPFGTDIRKGLESFREAPGKRLRPSDQTDRHSAFVKKQLKIVAM
jgi:hypothetical protein